MVIPGFAFKCRRYLSLLISFLMLASMIAWGQPAESTIALNSVAEKTAKAQLHQTLLDLTNPWTVMCVAAHPDDEDGSTLTVLRRKYGVHTVSLFSTYGEGGQNAVGPELYAELGVIRARETMAAAEVQGSEPHFLGLQDFGFSKSAEETFRVWGETEALRRMVFQIRQLRPDVIITNHDTTSGHGHHQATGRLILQAFDAAADAKQFPEQLKQVTTWQPQRLFVRAFRTQTGDISGAPNTQVPVQSVTVDPNERDPVRDSTYAQQALAGLQQHATQGPWPKTISPTGARLIRYNLVRQVASAAPLPENAKTVLDGLRLPETIADRFTAPTIDNKPLTEFVDNHGEVLVSLINAKKHGAFTAPKDVVAVDPQRFHLMSARLDKALATVAGVSLSITSAEKTLVPGVKTELEVSLVNSGDTEVAIKHLKSRGLPVDKQLDPAEKLLPGTETSQTIVVTTPKYAFISVPSAAHLYDGHLFGESFGVDADLGIEGVHFAVATELRMDVAPRIEIVNNNASPCVETPATVLSCLETSITVINHLNSPFTGTFESSSRVEDHIASQETEVVLAPHETRKLFTGKISSIPDKAVPSYRVRGTSINLTIRDKKSKESIVQQNIPIIYIPAIAVAGLRVGYVSSTDQTLKHSLSALGVKARELAAQDIQAGALTNFDTIIIDNRGYEAHPELITANDRLLKFVEDGGTMLVFYHKSNEWNPDERAKRPQLAPYPIILNDARVTQEDAPIQILQQGHPLLNFPNRIDQRDFAGWVQERGLYFPKEWDSHYTALLSTHDEGEPALKGGLLVARYGKGNYIYTSFVWYRQLRAGNPGGYRFFANLISYGHQK